MQSATDHAGRQSNNTIRNRIACLLAFLRWCDENGRPHRLSLAAIRRLKKQFPEVAGKAHAKNPARWLNRDEAFVTLPAACQDGSDLGMRDEVVIRLGLAGMRASEVATLTVRDVTGPGPWHWTGKGRKGRRMVPGRALADLIGRYLAAYRAGMGADAIADLPLICPATSPGRRMRWGHSLPVQNGTYATPIWAIVTRRAEEAGLGHVTPHDLRRSAAGILHDAKTDDGAHVFDLLDIQQVLGHADPATTMKHYLRPMDTDTLGAAGRYLD